MSSDPDGGSTVRRLGSGIRDAVSVRSGTSLVAGLTAGAGLALLNSDAVTLPLLGSVPGPAVGAVALAAGVGLYLKWGRCESCGAPGVGGTCDCEGSCSRE